MGGGQRVARHTTTQEGHVSQSWTHASAARANKQGASAVSLPSCCCGDRQQIRTASHASQLLLLLRPMPNFKALATLRSGLWRCNCHHPCQCCWLCCCRQWLRLLLLLLTVAHNTHAPASTTHGCLEDDGIADLHTTAVQISQHLAHCRTPSRQQLLRHTLTHPSLHTPAALFHRCCCGTFTNWLLPLLCLPLPSCCFDSLLL